MIRKLWWRVAFGGETPAIVKQLRDLERSVQNDVSSQRMRSEERREILRMLLLPVFPVLACLSCLAWAFLAGMFRDIGEVLIVEVFSGRVLIGVVLLIFAGSSVGRYELPLWIRAALCALSVICLSYLVLVTAAVAALAIALF